MKTNQPLSADKPDTMPMTPYLRPSKAPCVEFEDDFSLPEAYSMEECDLTSRSFTLDGSDGLSLFSDNSDKSFESYVSEDFFQRMGNQYPTSAVEYLSFGLLQSLRNKFTRTST